ncbi:MAG: 30S ribosome-binding factor RbfA, partial [Planctomycetota bacterium]
SCIDMAGHRIERVNEQIKREISRILLGEVKDPRVGPVTVTRVRTAPDLTLARVFVQLLGSDEEREETERGLRAALPFIRTTLGQRLDLRRVPELRFEQDRSLEHALRIEELLAREISSSIPDDAELTPGELVERMALTDRSEAELMQALLATAMADSTTRFRDVSQLQRRLLALATDRPLPPVQEGARPDAQALTPETHRVYGRKILAHGRPVAWQFIDTWYIIGPFPNEGRRHLNTRFPPETHIDLDATHTGKDGRELRWGWQQSGDLPIRPPNEEEYGVWYAYTELRSDRARALWMALGSDDKATVWINDQPVWISSDRLKGWNIDEAFRKVYLEPGVNRILFRLENGWINAAFSLGFFCVPADLATDQRPER